MYIMLNYLLLKLDGVSEHPLAEEDEKSAHPLTDLLLGVARCFAIDGVPYPLDIKMDWETGSCKGLFSGQDITNPCEEIFKCADVSAAKDKQSWDLVFLKYLLIAAALDAGVNPEKLSSSSWVLFCGDSYIPTKEDEVRPATEPGT